MPSFDYKDQNSLEKVVEIFNQHPDLVWLTGNFLIEMAGRKIVIPPGQLHLNSCIANQSVIILGKYP